MVINPCWPRRISLKKVKIPTQIIGEISTPPRGGISFRMGINKGSVGKPIKLPGKRLRSTWGYQVKTILRINKRDINPRTIPRARTEILAKFINILEIVGVKKANSGLVVAEATG
jgi:hypothetical protein